MSVRRCRRWLCRSIGASVITLLTVGALLAGSLPVAAQAVPLPPPPQIDSVKPALLKPGQEFRIRGRAFVDVKTVTMAGVSLPFRVRNKKQIIVTAPPSAARGAVTVSTRGGVVASPRVVVVRPSLQVSPQAGPIGSIVWVRGKGFIPGEPVDIFLGRLGQTSTTANGAGAIDTTFTVPAKTAPGVTFVRAQGRFSGVPVDRQHTVSASWPQRGLTASGNRRSQDAYLGATAAASLLLDWAADTIGPSRSSPAIVGDLVMAGADTGALLAVSMDCASSGESCTARAIGITRGAASSSPAVGDGLAFIGSSGGSLYAFALDCELEDGPCEPVWSFETGGPLTASPTFDGDVVAVGSADGNVYAFDPLCGAAGSDEGADDAETPCTPRWVAPTGGAIDSSPAVHDGVVYIGSDDGYLHAFETDCAFDGGTCESLWRGWTGGAIRSSPAVANGMVFVGSNDAKVHSFAVGCGDDGEICQAIWRGDADAPVESSPVVADGYVVAGTDAGSVMAFPAACADRDTGCAPTWTALTGGPVRSSPAISGSSAQGGPMVFVGSDDGFLYAYPLKCRPTGKPPICKAVWASGTSAPITASPAIVDGAVYVTSEDGTIRRWSLP